MRDGLIFWPYLLCEILELLTDWDWTRRALVRMELWAR